MCFSSGMDLKVLYEETASPQLPPHLGTFQTAPVLILAKNGLRQERSAVSCCAGSFLPTGHKLEFSQKREPQLRKGPGCTGLWCIVLLDD